MYGGFNTPIEGIPIPEYVHEQLSPEVKEAWEKFYEWWLEQGVPIGKKAMPVEIAQAYKTINEAPIPGFDFFLYRLLWLIWKKKL